MIRNTQTTGTRGKLYNMIKGNNEKPRVNTLLSGEKVKTFSLKSGIRRRHSVAPLLFNILQKGLSRELDEKK
jgi:hypothetical protein